MQGIIGKTYRRRRTKAAPELAGSNVIYLQGIPPLEYTDTNAETFFLSLKGSHVFGLSLSEGLPSRPESELAEEGLDFMPEKETVSGTFDFYFKLLHHTNYCA